MSCSWEQDLLSRVTRAFAFGKCVHVLCPSCALSERVASLLTQHCDQLTVIHSSTPADAVRVETQREVFLATYDDLCTLYLRVGLVAPDRAEFFSASAAVLVDYDPFNIGAFQCMLRSEDGDIVSQSEIHRFLGAYKHCMEFHTQ